MSALARCRLGNVATFVRGISFKPDDVVTVGSPGSVACLRTKNVQAELDLSDVWGVDESFVKRDNQYLMRGDIIVSSANSWNLVGKCCWVPDLPWRSSFGGFVSVLRAESGKVDSRYLFYWFASRRIQATVRSYGQQTTNISNLNVERCLNLSVPLPPLPEQRRVVGILDRTEALRAKRRAGITQLDTLPQAIFFEMFGDPATNPKGWPVRPIGEITECLDRLRKPITESDRTPGPVPYYGANGRQGWIDSALFDEPLVLVAEDGGHFDTPERGVAYRIDGPAWVNNHAHILRAMPEHLNTEFLHRALRHYNFMPFISGTTRAKLTQGQLNVARLIVPPLALQADFGRRVAAVDQLKVTYRAALSKLDVLFASLQHRAFRGEL